MPPYIQMMDRFVLDLDPTAASGDRSVMEPFFLSSRRERKLRTSPGTRRIRTWQFLLMPRRFRRIQAPLLSTRLLKKLQPSLTWFHLLVTTESHQTTGVAVESYRTPAGSCACSPWSYSSGRNYQAHPFGLHCDSALLLPQLAP